MVASSSNILKKQPISFFGSSRLLSFSLRVLYLIHKLSMFWSLLKVTVYLQDLEEELGRAKEMFTELEGEMMSKEVIASYRY